MQPKTLLVIALLVSTAAGAPAQEQRAFTVEDLWALERVDGPVMSPDGRWLAVTLTCYDMESNESQSDLWLLATDGSEVRRLTTHPKNDSAPAWSPDGRTIAFVSNREGDAAQLYLIRVDGGEARRLTDIPTGAGGHRWFPGGRRIAFVSRVWPDCADDDCNAERLEERRESLVKAHATEDTLYRYWDHWVDDGRVPHIFVADVESGEHRDLFAGSEWHLNLTRSGAGSYDISPDGGEICFAFDTARNPGLDGNMDLYLMALESGEVERITDNEARDGSPAYSPDGRWIAYGMTRSKFGPDYTRIVLHDRADGGPRVLTEAFEHSSSGWVWSADCDRLYFTAGVRARAPIFTVSTVGGDVRTVLEGNTMSSVQLSPDGETIYFSRQGFSLPPTIFAAATADGSERQLSRFNDELLAGIAWAGVEEHYFEGVGGDEVQILLLKPAGFDPELRWPLVHMIHGGPHGVFGDIFHFRWNAQLFAAPGYVVACVNFHGSTTFGFDFLDSIAGGEGDKPFDDVLLGTDYLLGLGYIDAERMAATGGSYGGYLVNWINSQTDRFACLVSHAGAFNHHGMFASDTPRFRERRWGGFPWADQANTDRWSPNRFAADIGTPTLVIHGELDYRVVVTQGIELYNTLNLLGVPARLLYYPDEGHWIRKPQNARLWYGEVHAWLERWIGAGPSESD